MLELKNVKAGYGKAEVLHGVSLEVRPGEAVALVGPNGAGKTTVIRTIIGELAPFEGSIGFNGEDICGLPSHKIARLGIACSPEGRNIFGNLTVYENLRMGGYLLNDKKVIKEHLDWVYSLFPRIAERRKQLAESLSGGEQQMLAIGRAIMNAPSLLFLDEPSLGIAPVVVDAIYECIGEINRAGTSVLLVEQNVGLALEVTERAYVMESGEIKLSGRSQELLDDRYVLDTYLGVR